MRGIRSRLSGMFLEERGSAPVEFVLVGSLLTLLTFAVLQLGFAVYVRNVVHDAAVEGAYHAALADTTLADGARRTCDIVSLSVDAACEVDVVVHESAVPGGATVVMTARTTLPLVGLLGIPRMLEVTAHAPAESFE